MLKNVIYYSFSNAVGRSFPILSSPLILLYFSLDVLGIYNLALVTSYLVAPIINLNGASGILREGVKSKETSVYFLKQYSIIILLISIPLIGISYLFDTSNLKWVTFALTNGVLESFYLIIITWLRARDYASCFLYINLGKVLSLLTGLLICLSLFKSTTTIYVAHLCLSFITVITGYTFAFFKSFDIKINKKTSKKLLPTIKYTTPLIILSVTQWGINNLDRYIIKVVMDNTFLGTYTFVYNIAMISLIFITGISITLPTYFIKNFAFYRSNEFRKKFNLYFSLLYSLLCLCIITGYHVYNYLFSFTSSPEQLIILCIILYGFYFLGLYYQYGMILLKFRQSQKIVTINIVTLFFNIFFTMIGVTYFGILGAAISTSISYLVLLILVIKISANFEPSITVNNIMHEFEYTWVVPLSIFLISFFFI